MLYEKGEPSNLLDGYEGNDLSMFSKPIQDRLDTLPELSRKLQMLANFEKMQNLPNGATKYINSTRARLMSQSGEGEFSKSQPN